MKMSQVNEAKGREPVDEIKNYYKNDKNLTASVIGWLESGVWSDSVDYRRDSAEICHYRQYINQLHYQYAVA